MSEVSITINKRAYTVYCDEGQEDHLRRLAERVDGHVAELVSANGQIGDLRLLIMASLLMADELQEMEGQRNRAVSAAESGDVMSAPEASVVRGIEALATRVEAVAAEIERAADQLNPPAHGPV